MTVHIGMKDGANPGFREVQSCVNRHFDAVAKQYDIMNTLLSFGIHHLWKRIAVRMANLEAGDRVLDVCGGTGDLSVLAKKAVGHDGQVILCDINREMMEAGRNARNHIEIRQNILYVRGNAEMLSFPDNSFDAAMVGFGIRNLTNMETGFREMHRVLKPGGRMMCLEFSEPVNPLFRVLYDMYSFHIMPWVGEFVVGSRQAYTYLPESIRLFPSPDTLKVMLENTGFAEVSFRRLINGIAVVHTGSKSA